MKPTRTRRGQARVLATLVAIVVSGAVLVSACQSTATVDPGVDACSAVCSLETTFGCAGSCDCAKCSEAPASCYNTLDCQAGAATCSAIDSCPAPPADCAAFMATLCP